MKLQRLTVVANHRKELIILGTLLGFFLLFFRRAITGHEFLLIYDPFSYSYPLRTIAWEHIRNAEWPMWTPLILSGYPLFSMAQLGLAYPLTWGYLLLPGHIAEQIFVLAPFLLSSIFTYAYVREIGLSRVGGIIGGLSFAYGGMMAGGLSNGLMPNAVIWLPLALIAIERSRHRPLINCWLSASLCYLLSVLTGVGQGFLYAGIVIAAYALWITTFVSRNNTQKELSTENRWNPLIVGAGSLITAAGIAAFQILETAQAAALSVRSKLSYDTFGEMAYTPVIALKAMLAPPYHCIETSPYLTPLALLLVSITGISVITGVRTQLRQNARQVFWLILAGSAWILMLGDHTPLYKLIYHVPILNWFRGASRHSFEWTFAASILAAYGWDKVVGIFHHDMARSYRKSRFVICLICFLLLIAVGAGWFFWAESKFGRLDTETSYLYWKIVFSLLVILSLWLACQLKPSDIKNCVVFAIVLLSCFTEPYILKAKWWGRIAAMPAHRFTVVPESSRWLRQFPPEQNRVYVRARLFSEQTSLNPLLDAPNLTALRGLQNAAGYEPLILERYSRALGNVWLDGILPAAGEPGPNSIWGSRSHVLDLLNVTFVASYTNWETSPINTFEREGIVFDSTDLGLTMESPMTAILCTTTRFPVDTLVIVSSLANSVEIANGTVIAELRIVSGDGSIIKRQLRAGYDTAEWAHERPDVKPLVRHNLAPVFDSFPTDDFISYNYIARIHLGQRVDIARIEIDKVDSKPSLIVFKASIHDTGSRMSAPLTIEKPIYSELRREDNRWQIVSNRDGIVITHNKRALPRAWLVANIEKVHAVEALRQIQGEGEKDFDPRRTALVEVEDQNQIPDLSNSHLLADSKVNIISYKENSMVIDTEAKVSSFLVLSEIYYPGWVATIDGEQQPIYTTNYLLRGMYLPAGKHRIEMRYKAPAARTGGIISALTLLVMCSAGFYIRLRAH